ncbi:UDP-N-acetylglucosamine acyltransferase [Amycolatopsis sp. Poz14]|uniref:UDP-N-acetylglucosamine acyltransferase n=1 Tax=Amycolatopsis sp. Poz14 TaxID=1447705 RepID=UPI001EE902A1|nr:UDP-N-acetylglucosamine acyltransferase [Amycolatopsis sp. Poz14]MCG3749309.1 UDP-N-acetylglucosamine acyltransferase [Amycolatopsis sp. Poz14]
MSPAAPNRIHPTAVVGEGVELGEGNVIGPYAVIVGPARIGDGNWIGPHVTIGTPGEDRGGPHPAAWEGAPTGDPAQDGHGVVVGSRNRIREYTSIQQGTWRATTLGDDCYVLRGSHIGHDVLVDDQVTLACNVMLGGHTHVWSFANLGMGTVVHQGGSIGPGAMVGMGSAVRREVGAFTITVGNPARVTGVNTVGLSRRGLDEAAVEALGPWVKGKGDLPDDGLPEDLSTLVRAWDARPREEH